MNPLIKYVANDLGLKPDGLSLHPAGSGASSKKLFHFRGISDSIYPQPFLIMQAPGTTIADYCDVTLFLQDRGIRVPKIFYHNVDHEYCVVEDCGTTTLERLMKKTDSSQTIQYYKSAIDLLCLIQTIPSNPTSVVQTRAFDKNKYDYEYHFHFCLKLIKEYYDYTLSVTERFTFDRLHDAITRVLIQQPTVFVHRDFQSSNLLWFNDEWVVTDHQDARMGPALYDLVSLIEDVYVQLRHDEKDNVLKHYTEAAMKKGIRIPGQDQFRYVYDMITIQRKLHDAGAFVFSFQNFGNVKYLSYIKTVVDQALDVMSRYPEFALAHELLTMISHDHHTEE